VSHSGSATPGSCFGRPPLAAADGTKLSNRGLPAAILPRNSPHWTAWRNPHPSPAQGERRLSTLDTFSARRRCLLLTAPTSRPPSPASLQDGAEGDKSAGTKPDEPKLEGAALLEAIKKQVPMKSPAPPPPILSEVCSMYPVVHLCACVFVRVCIESLPDNLVMNGLTLSCLVQIEYYFSKENLMQDSFLVSKMDKEYYVELAVLADFHLLKVLTTDEKLIIEAIKGSKKVRPMSPALLRHRYPHFFVCCQSR
jgi:hypothetical protein